MKKDQTIKEIIHLPEISIKENISMYNLLKKTGYFEVYNQINENDILNELIHCADYIELWLNLSENKRTNSGWYLKYNTNGHYIVGFLNEGIELNVTEYQDKILACAIFIKNEIEEIRNSSLSH